MSASKSASPYQRPFVGRLTELKQFDEVLKSPQGQAIVVVGQQGMGKTLLLDEFANLALKHNDLCCEAFRCHGPYPATRPQPLTPHIAYSCRRIDNPCVGKRTCFRIHNVWI